MPKLHNEEIIAIVYQLLFVFFRHSMWHDTAIFARGRVYSTGQFHATSALECVLHPMFAGESEDVYIYRGANPYSKACAVRIGELTFRDGYVVYFVGWQIDSEGNRTEVLKSADAYRYTVGGFLAYKLIKTRIAALREAGFTAEEINTMPLVCDPKDPKKYARSQDLSAYTRKLILICGYEEEALAAAETLMQREPDVVDGIRETDVSAYLLRRDFVSRCINRCGMDSADVDYLVGHKRTDKSTRPFSSPDTQGEVAGELERCVLHVDYTRHPVYSPVILGSSRASAFCSLLWRETNE